MRFQLIVIILIAKQCVVLINLTENFQSVMYIFPDVYAKYNYLNLYIICNTLIQSYNSCIIFYMCTLVRKLRCHCPNNKFTILFQITKKTTVYFEKKALHIHTSIKNSITFAL